MAERPYAKRVYVAARFSRQAEMARMAAELRQCGYLCNPAWLGEDHDLPLNAPEGDARGARFAQDDWNDLRDSDIVVCFTEKPGDTSARGRGGRHVELGLALAWEKRVIVIGHRENVFCWLPQVEFYREWSDALLKLWSDAGAPADPAGVPDHAPPSDRKSAACF